MPLMNDPLRPCGRLPLFLRTPYQGFYIEPRFGNLLVDVHASVEDEQDPGGILTQGVEDEDIVSALENQPSYATCSVNRPGFTGG